MIWRTVSIIVLLLLLWNAVKWFMFRQQARALSVESAQWPTTYDVGSRDRSPLLYVVLGDSTALGTGASHREGSYAYQVADALARDRFVRVVNLAVVGARIADVVTRQVPQLSLLKPDVISVSVGANDAAHATPSSEYQHSLDALVRSLQESSASVVLFANTPNMSFVPSLPVVVRQRIGSRAARQNVLLSTVLAGSSAQIRLVDLYGKGQLNAKENPAYYARDQYHPADAGYAVWARIFADTAREIRSPRFFEGA
ncbi:MAG: GDSL-type esterase/lipase family protein [bacterium]|nr:GDSL-type esterase/lipase family protein [bacterium]